MLSIFRHRQANHSPLSQRAIVRRIVCVVSSLLLSLALAACGFDAPPLPTPCAANGGDASKPGR